MKKFLTVLLALSVVFTYTVGTAFAATKTEVSSSIDTQTAEYQAALTRAGEVYMDTLTFSSGMLTTNDAYTGLVSKAVVIAAKDAAVYQAQSDLAAYAKTLQNALVDNDENDKEAALADLKDKFDELKGQYIADAYILGTDLINVLPSQLEADKKAALAEMNNYDALLYSDNIDEWSISLGKTSVAGNYLAFKDNGRPVYDAEVAAGTYNLPNSQAYTVDRVTGMSKEAEEKFLSAREFVSAVKTTQTKIVSDAAVTDTTDATQYKTAIEAVAGAAKTAKDVIKGHKLDSVTTGENYYVEAIPTIEDLKADTSVETAKATAAKVIKADLAKKAVDLEKGLTDAIDALNKKSNLTSAEKTLLAELKDQLADLDEQIAAAEEVMLAKIDYCTTTAQVDDVKATITTEIETYENNDNGTIKGTTLNTLKGYVKTTEDVDALEKEAEVILKQLDVNGQQFVDKEVLAETLAEQTEKLYNGETTLSQAKAELWRGWETALVVMKANYIDYVTGEPVVDGGTVSSPTYWVPKDKNGKALKDIAWNKSDAGTVIEDDVTVSAFTTTPYNAYDEGDEPYLYDKAQRGELAQLVDETKAAIKDAKTASEVTTAFLAAQEKYEAIPTIHDHNKSWANGKLAVAYANGDYEKELQAYAKYFVEKVYTSKYPSQLGTPAGVLENVAYPVMYEAYTPEELPAKLAEAKTAIDNILTIDGVKAEKEKVEATIAKIPSTVALTDKDAITAAADALDAYNYIPGSEVFTPANVTKLTDAKIAYEKLAAAELDSAYKALNSKTITVDDEAAVTALRDLYKAYAKYVDDYAVASTATTDNADVADLEAKLSDAKVQAVRELMIAIPANPTEKDRAAVEAARKAYEALTLKEQARLVGSLPYDNLIDAEEALGVNASKAVEALKITASSKAKKGSITVKWKVDGDASGVTYFDIRKSTKKNSGFGNKPYFKTKDGTARQYKNTKGLKKGTRYYYKVRAVAVIDGVEYTSDWSNKAYRIAK